MIGQLLSVAGTIAPPAAPPENGAEREPPASKPGVEGERSSRGTAGEGAALDATDGEPVYLFVDREDLETIWKKLNSPDWVLLSGKQYARLARNEDRSRKEQQASDYVVGSVAATGKVGGDHAELTIEYQVDLAVPGPIWAAIGLDGQTLSRATEAGRDLPLRNRPPNPPADRSDAQAGAGAAALPPAARGGAAGSGSSPWEVELSGKGVHRFQVRLLAPIRPTAEGEKIEMAIPEAASTLISVDVPGQAVEAAAGASDIAFESIENGAATRLAAHLTPRSTLELTWRRVAEAGVQLPPLVTAEGNVALEIDTQEIRAICRWEVRAERGIARSLEFTIDPGDEVVSIELDDRPLASERRSSSDPAKLAIPLSDPLRPGAPRRLAMTLRRPIPPSGAGSGSRGVEVKFGGFPIANAASQGGILEILPRDEVLISTLPGSGVRRIEPRRSEGRKNVITFRYNEQPYQLMLRIDPAEPAISVDARTEILADGESASVRSRLEYRVARGSVFETRIGLAKGLELESVGPAEYVAVARWRPADPGPAAPDLNAAPRVLTVELTPKARTDGAFTLELVGRRRFKPGGVTDVGLFAPLDAALADGRLTIGSKSSSFRVELAADPESVPASFVAVSPREAQAATGATAIGVRRGELAVFRLEGNPRSAPVSVTIRPREIEHRTIVRAVVGRDAVEIRQETAFQIDHGALSAVDVLVPAAIAGAWDLDDLNVTTAVRIGKPDRDGERYRLRPTREMSGLVKLRFRARVKPAGGLSPRPMRVEIPRIVPLEGTSLPTLVLVFADPSIAITALAGEGQTIASEPASAASEVGDEGAAPRVALLSESAAPAVFNISAAPLVELPSAVASRVWVRSRRGGDGRVLTAAWYRLETRSAELSVALPPGSRCERVWAGGDSVTTVERISDSAGSGPSFRIPLPPATASGPYLVGIEYGAPAGSAAAWEVPRLLGGAVVQQTYWVISAPRSMSLLGTPAGWSDVNQWRWSGFGFARSSALGETEPAEWVAGSASRIRSLAAGDEIAARSFANFAFSRYGNPQASRVILVRRWVLVGAASAVTLAFGLALLFARPPARWTAAFAALAAFGLAAGLEPNLAIALTQAGALGVGLTALAAVVQYALDRSPLERPARSRSSHRVGLIKLAGAAGGGSIAGADDPTRIRPRPDSAAERSAPEAPDAAPDILSTREHVKEPVEL